MIQNAVATAATISIATITELVVFFVSRFISAAF
jgi:hypothetical protein